MAQITTSSFTTWKLTDQETLEGSVLSNPQKFLIQNELANVAEQILALEYKTLEPLKFAQDDSFLKGQLSILRFLLLRSDESEIQLKYRQDNSGNS